MPKRRALLALLAPLLLSACASDISDLDADKAVIATTEVRSTLAKRAADTLLIDARPPSAFTAGHLPGAVNLSVIHVSGVPGQTDPRLEKYETLVVYGEDPGSASARALVKRLIATGYDDVRYYQGGMMDWTATGGQVVKKQP